MKKKDSYPEEIVFKAVYRNEKPLIESLKKILSNHLVEGTITSKESSNAKFISYTVTAVFDSEQIVQQICDEFSSIEGFMMLF